MNLSEKLDVNSMYITAFDSFNQSSSALSYDESSCDAVLQYDDVKLSSSSSFDDLFLKLSFNSQVSSHGNEECNYIKEELDSPVENISRRVLKEAFEKWRRKLRLKILENESSDEILSREYYRRKAEYQLHQKNCIASVHFKIGILSDSFHKWRLFTIATHVKRRRQEVAKVHYGDHIIDRYFNTWKESLKEKRCQQKKISTFIMSRTLKTWKRQTSLSRDCNRQKYEFAVKYSNIVILKAAYVGWRREALETKAQSHYELHYTKRAFTVWSLQLLKRKLQRRLARSYRRRSAQQKFFTKWKSAMCKKLGTRNQFSVKLEMFVLRYFWERLKKGVAEETLMRANAAAINEICQKNFAQHYFSIWKHQYRIECFKLQTEENNCRYVMKMYFELWKKRRKKSLLHRKMILWNTIQGKLISLEFFSRWQHQKHKRVQKNRDFEKYIAIIEQNKVARSFTIWKHKFEVECRIKTFIRASEQRLVTRCFNLWILVKRRGELLKMQQINILSKSFSYWRDSAEERVDMQRRKMERDVHILQKCIVQWKDVVSLSMQRKETSVICFARHWLDVTQQRSMSRRIVQAEKESCELITKVHFAKWQHQFNAAVRKRLALEGVADKHYRYMVCFKVLTRWSRQHHITGMVRNYQADKSQVLLAACFKHWVHIIEADMKSLIHSFTEKLVLNDNDSLCSTLVHEENLSPPLSTLSKTNDTLVNLYQESIESSLLQENECLALQIGSKGSLRETNEFGSNSSLAQALKTEQSDFVSVSLHFSASDTNNDFSSNAAFNQELVDYNTDNDVDQDQIFEEPINHSQLRLNFSSFSNATSDDNYFMSDHFSFQPADVSIDNTCAPQWIYSWKKRYLHSTILSQQKRFLHHDLTIPAYTSVIPALSRSSSRRSPVNVKLVLSGEDMTIPKRNIDGRKVCLLVATLNYWKHLDVSAIFYALLAYTQKKKYLRLMQDYLLEKKRRYRSHVVFLEWNRKLYGERAFAYFREKSVKGWYFGQWMKYHLFQQLKLSRLQDADEHRRKCLVKSNLVEWRKKCRLEYLLSGINNSWNDDVEMFLNNTIAVKEKKTLEGFFRSWRGSTLQMKSSKRHWDKVAQKRCIDMWRLFVADKELVREKVKCFQKDHQLKRVFFTWKRKMQCRVQIRKVEMTKDCDTKALVFSEWRKWSQSRLGTRLRGNVFCYKSNYQLLYDAFREWVVNYRQTVYAVEHKNFVLCRNVFSSWRDVACQRVIYEKKMAMFRSKLSMHLLSKMFITWKQANVSRLKLKTNNKQREGHALSITFMAWKETTLHSKADRRYVDSRCRPVFKIWKEKYVSRKELQFLAKISCKKWKKLVQRGKSNELVLQEYLIEKNLLIKRHYFLKWRQHLQERKHCERNLLFVREIAVHWKLKTKEHLFVSHKESKSLEKYFLLWVRNYFQRRKAIALHEMNTKRRCLLSWINFSRKKREMDSWAVAYIELKESRLVNIAFLKWRSLRIQVEAQKLSDAQELVATEYYKQHLIQALFYKWTVFVRVEQIQRMRRKRIARKYYEKWRSAVLAGNAIVAMFCQNTCEKYWRCWRKNYVRNHVLKVMEKREERRMLSVVFASWSRHALLKRSLPKKMKLVQTSIWFRKWKERCGISYHHTA